MTQSPILCSVCGKKGARLLRVTRSYGRGAGEFLVSNIPAMSCRLCGESYFSAATVRELERICANHKSLTVKKQFAVASFPPKSRRRAS